jgi:hypothetical protein
MQSLVTGDMHDARVRHSATLLSDGTVLVAGGASASDPGGLGQNALVSAELYVSSALGFKSVSNLNAGRWGHSATLLHDGTVFLAGGFDAAGNALGSSEIYQPADGKFVVGPSLAFARGLHTATLLADGRVLVIGGATTNDLVSPVDPAEIYDPARGTIASIDHEGSTVPNAAVLLADGRVDLIWPKTHRQELFLPSSGGDVDSFQDGTPLPEALGIDLQALRLGDGSVELSSPISGTRSAAQIVALAPGGAELWRMNAAVPRTDTGFGAPSAIALAADLIWQVGAAPADDFGPTASQNSCSQPFFDVNQLPDGPASFDVVSGGPLNRSWPTATALPDGTVLVVGGIGAASCGATPAPTASSARIYAGAWSQRSLDAPDADLYPNFVQAASVLLGNGSALFAEGFGSSGHPTRFDRVAVFDGASFASIPLLSARVLPLALLRDSGEVLVAGGDTETPDAPEELVDTRSGITQSAGFRLSARGSGVALLGGATLFAGRDALELVEPDAMSGALTVHPIALPESLACDHPELLRMPNGRVLVAGLETLFEFDPVSLSLSMKAQLQEPRCDPFARILGDGTVALIGGTTTDQAQSSSLEVYDPQTGTTRLLSDIQLEPGILANNPTAGLWFDQLLIGSEEFSFDWQTRNGLREVQPFPGIGTGSLVLLPDARLLAMPSYGGTASFLRMGAQLADTKFQFPDTPPHVHMGDVWNVDHGFSAVEREGSSGTNSQSASNAPVLAWIPVVDGWPALGTILDWTSKGAVWKVPGTPFPGLGLLFVATNGKLSGLGPLFIDPSTQGSSCSLGGECETGYCVDGVCCDSACDGTCQACSQQRKGSGLDGQCGALSAGQPDAACAKGSPDACEQSGTCDGAGNCARYEGTPCLGSGICAAGKCIRSANEDICDGDHTVTNADGSSAKDCGRYRCSLADGKCLERCSTNGDCVAGAVCGVSHQCEAPLPASPAPAAGCSCFVGAGHADRDSGAWAMLVALACAARQRRKKPRACVRIAISSRGRRVRSAPTL